MFPWRKYMARGSVWKAVPLLVVGLSFIVVVIILDSLMPSGYSAFEFAFSGANFAVAIGPFRGRVYESQLLLLNAGLHYIASFGIFLGLAAACAWAANHDATHVFGMPGVVGDVVCLLLICGVFMEWIAHAMIIYACVGFEPNGLRMIDMYFLIYGLLIVFKDVFLAVGVVYFVVVRVCAWTCWSDCDNTPEWDVDRAAHKTPSNVPLQAMNASANDY